MKDAEQLCCVRMGVRTKLPADKTLSNKTPSGLKPLGQNPQLTKPLGQKFLGQ